MGRRIGQRRAPDREKTRAKTPGPDHGIGLTMRPDDARTARGTSSRLIAVRREEAGTAMKNRLGLTFLATGTLVLAAVSACADSDADPRRRRQPPSTVRRVDSADEPAPLRPLRPTPRSPMRRAAMTDYYAVLDELRPIRPAISRSSSTVAIGAQLNAVQTLVSGSAIRASARPAPRHQRAQGPVGQPRQLRPGRRQGADGRHRRLLGRQRGRRARQERQVDRLPRPPGHRVDALHRRELRLRRRSRPAAGAWRRARTSSRRHARHPDSPPR